MEQKERQALLLESILGLTSFTARRERLAAVWPEIEWSFFPVLSQAVEQARVGETVGLELCEGLVEASGGLDLREDWGPQQRLIIWGTAWFTQRHTVFRVLIEDQRPQMLNYEILQDWVMSALQLAQVKNRPVPALAMLNVLLAAAPWAVGGSPPAPQEERLRYEITTAAAGVVISHKIGDYRSSAGRLLSEADSLYKQISARRMDDSFRLTLELSAQNLRFLSGDLARAAGDVEVAISRYRQALQEGEALTSRASARPELAALSPRLGLCVPNTLWRLADAEVLAWRLDDAYNHLERAIREYRQLGDSDKDLVGHLEMIARVEFLRTNFERAEELLRQAARAREEMQQE